MQPDRWKRIKEIFHGALSLPPDQRARFLDSSCENDAELRAEVDSLLKSNQDAGQFLEAPSKSADRTLSQVSESWVGKRIGVYQITESVGQGGMGVVYRAEDTRLGRSVALKFLPASLRDDSQALERFAREARAASALNHPSICTIYGVDDWEGHPYIAMELLEGQTLQQLIASGPLDAKRILDVAIPAAEALESAHGQGIIHRDIKPSNIFLTQRGQVKILDFGLAKHYDAASEASLNDSSAHFSLTSPGMAVGTVSYMSPEQARGEKLDARSDIFSFGAVLYEMATGLKAFPGRGAVLIYDAILNRAPAPITEINPSISAQLAAVISKAMEKDREARYQSVSELRTDLARMRTGISTGATPISTVPSSWFWRLAVMAGVALLILGAASGYWWRLRRTTPNGVPSVGVADRSASAPFARKSVAVIGFKNLSGRSEQQWLSTAFAEMLSTELAAGGDLRVIPGENVVRTKADLSLSEAESYSAETLNRIRKNLGADYVVLGRYLETYSGESAGIIRVDVLVQDALAGETIATFTRTGNEAQLIDLLSLTGSDLRSRLLPGSAASREAALAEAALPTNRDAARLYTEGLASMRQYEPLLARDQLVKAAAIEPSCSLIHAALAQTWSQLGFDQKAAEEAKLAAGLTERLPQSLKLWIEGLYRTTANDWDKAVAVYQTLFAIAPDNVDYGLLLADAQTRSGNARDALATVASLRKLPLPQSDDPRIDLAEGAAAEQLSDYDRAQAAAIRAAAKADAQDAKLLKARARALQASALEYPGRYRESISAAREAASAFLAAGHRRGAAQAMLTIGNAQRSMGDANEARKSFEEALRFNREAGNQRGIATTLNDLAIVYDDAGNLTAALTQYQEALAVQRTISDKVAQAKTLGNIGVNLHLQGDLRGALQSTQQAVALAHEVGDRSTEAIETNTVGEILVDLGFLAGAREKDDAALSLAQQVNDRSEVAFALYSRAIVKLHMGDLSGSRKDHEEALAIRKELGEKTTTAESLMALAELTIEEGHFAEASARLDEIRPVFERAKGLDDMILCDTLSARALLGQGHLAEARKRIGRAQALGAKSQEAGARLARSITTSWVLAASKQPDQARRLLEGARDEAKRLGYLGYELHARLAMGALSAQFGDAAGGKAQLATLRADATAREFHLIAKKAASFL